VEVAGFDGARPPAGIVDFFLMAYNQTRKSLAD
jgi:hypothetical protein